MIDIMTFIQFNIIFHLMKNVRFIFFAGSAFRRKTSKLQRMIYKDNKERLCLQLEVPRYYELYVSNLCPLVREVS